MLVIPSICPMVETFASNSISLMQRVVASKLNFHFHLGAFKLLGGGTVVVFQIF